ncbi:shikimate kinase [Clostridia bacterium]|nr:shikimate kinase [Clostridia bacterium]
MTRMEKISNISLIGMTGTGKTTLGRLLAIKTYRAFVDLDEVIVKTTGRTIPSIFAEEGESYFRDIETCEMKRLFEERGWLNGAVLSTGGGAVLREENRVILRDNSQVIWLIRPTEKILESKDVLTRPPVNGDPDRYREILQSRKPLYEAAAHIIIEYTDISEAVERILSMI